MVVHVVCRHTQVTVVYVYCQHDSDSEEEGGAKMSVEKSFVSHVPVPSQQEVEEMLIRRKKRVS